jgi:hypothetical protein
MDQSSFTIDFLSPPDPFDRGSTPVIKVAQTVHPNQVQPHCWAKNKQPIVFYDSNEEFIYAEANGKDGNHSTLYSGKNYDNLTVSSNIKFWNEATNI